MKAMDDIKFLFSYAWKKGKGLFFIVSVQSVFSAFLPIINIVGLGAIIDALMAGEHYNGVMKLIIIYILINLGISILSYIFTYIQNIFVRKVSNSMQFDYAKDSLYINYHYVQDGSILDLKKKSMRINPAISLSAFGEFLNYIVQFVGIIYIFSILSPMFIIVIALTCFLSIILTFKRRKIDYDFQNSRIEDDRKSDYLYKVMTDYQFAKEVRLNNAGDYVNDKYQSILKIQMNKLKAIYKKTMRIELLRIIITIVQTAAMYFYFSSQVFSGQITIANYTILLGATTLLTSILIGFFDNIAQLNNTCKDVDFYREYSELIKTKSNITGSNNLPQKDIDFVNATIIFANVSFTYPGTEKEVLKNINLKIKKGERIGIVGMNGSGKTTLIKLLTRIYEPTEGLITINGIDIKEIPFKQYSTYIGIVLQDFLLFAYSIKENIAFDNKVDEIKLIRSLEKSGLKDKIGSLKNKTDTVIYKQLDDDGIEFSGGEGQKLALARAIYKNAELLILDEPTSALDPIAEYEFFSKLNDIAENKTALFISHRLSSTRFCDRIIVLENGVITECGNHNELIKNNGTYADLFNAQARYYKENGVAI